MDGIIDGSIITSNKLLFKFTLCILGKPVKLKVPVSLLLDNKRTSRDGIYSNAVNEVISLSKHIKLVKLGNDVMFTVPLNFGVDVPQLIAKILLGLDVLIDKLILIKRMIIACF